MVVGGRQGCWLRASEGREMRGGGHFTWCQPSRNSLEPEAPGEVGRVLWLKGTLWYSTRVPTPALLCPVSSWSVCPYLS